MSEPTIKQIMHTALGIKDTPMQTPDELIYTEADLGRAREEATVAAAGAMREKFRLLARQVYDDTLTCTIEEAIDNVSLVTSEQSQAWLREHDAAIRATSAKEAYERCAEQMTLLTNVKGFSEAAYALMRDSAGLFTKWATGTPAGTP